MTLCMNYVIIKITISSICGDFVVNAFHPFTHLTNPRKCDHEPYFAAEETGTDKLANLIKAAEQLMLEPVFGARYSGFRIQAPSLYVIWGNFNYCISKVMAVTFFYIFQKICRILREII